MIQPGKASSILNRLERFGIRLGLEQTRGLLSALGEPQNRVPAVLVAGTNGKGSTAALLACMASAAGYRTGLFTSPHLEEVEERLRIDGRAIDRDRLGDLLQQAVGRGEHLCGTVPTYFEALTVAALCYFAEESVDLAVLEVGMGGRLDATNVVEPALSVITSISLDHQAHLGTSLAAIAQEKAGILRSGVAAVAWVEEPEASAALQQAAHEVGAEFVLAQEHVELDAVEPKNWQQVLVSLRTPERAYELEVSLLGEHQAKNLGLAVLAAERLAAGGFRRLDSTSISQGARNCRWPGRLEVVEIPDGRRVVLDGAHNRGGAEALLRFLDRLDGPYDLLFGAMMDKDVADFLPALAAGAGRIILTMPASPRAGRPGDLALLLPEHQVAVQPSVQRSLDAALESSTPTLLVCGSIYVVGEVRRALRQRFGVPGSSLSSSV